MKRFTGLMVITFLVVFGCSAAMAQGSVTLGLLDITGTGMYCDYIDFGAGVPLAAGINHSEVCGTPDATMIGALANIPNSNNTFIKGPAYVLADNTNDMLCFCDPELAVIFVTQTKASKNHLGWEVYANFYDEYEVVLFNAGYLTNKLPNSPFIGSTPVSKKSAVAVK